MRFHERGNLLYAAYYFLTGALLLFVHSRLAPYAEDDSFIHLRLARNLLEHGVPYFNADEAVMSGSSSGWTMTLFLLFRIFGFAPAILPWLHTAVCVLSLFIFNRLFSVLSGTNSWQQLILSSLVVLPVCLLSSLGFMESAAALCLMGAGAAGYYSGKKYSFLFFAMAVFFRLELSIVFLIFFSANFFYKRIPLLHAMGWSIAGALPFVCYNLFFFGTNVPHTIKAKSLIFILNPLESLRHEWMSYIPGNPIGKYVEIILILLLCAWLVLRRLKWETAESFLLLFSGLAIASAYVVKKAMIFPWYVPLYTLPVFFGLAVLVYHNRSKAQMVLLLFILLPYWGITAQSLYAAVSGNYAGYKNFGPGARVKQYLHIGELLHERYPEASLLTSEIGGLGYAFRGRIIDGCGLISPEAIKYHPMKVPEERSSGLAGAIPVEFVRDKNPELVVSHDIFCEAFAKSELAKNNYVLTRYPIFTEEDQKISGEQMLWGSRYLNVYIRKDVYSEIK